VGVSCAYHRANPREFRRNRLTPSSTTDLLRVRHGSDVYEGGWISAEGGIEGEGTRSQLKKIPLLMGKRDELQPTVRNILQREWESEA